MKKLINLLFGISIALLLSAMQCDRDPLNVRSIFVENLITIETKNNYVVNDSIIVNASFSRFLPETGYSNLLDIFKSSNSNGFIFNIYIKKKLNDDSWEQIDLRPIIVLKKGSLSQYNEFTSILNPAINQYEFKASFPLLEIGEYEIDISEGLRQNNQSSKVILELSTNIDELNQDGVYLFTVN